MIRRTFFLILSNNSGLILPTEHYYDHVMILHMHRYRGLDTREYWGKNVTEEQRKFSIEV